MSQIGDGNRPPRTISIRGANEFFPARRCRKREATRSEGKADFYTVAQLAIRWALSERQVHPYAASEELKVTRFGRSVRVSAAEVARFEASRT